ncbi:ImmA/IrrE family metallo-endopeptidase [Nitrospirillum bahiense]|uniref:Zn-dependent peptidase ImmA (M78 family) n=1 Tax=Nitrospirillum amazonense TaxID=28077 RepID=A0A560FHP6_9PROT|nr:ImmA/IrrE family metallo-endopeptidase [Nitrospirillum amazonense]TWB21124.1 Zn-dependent peptidase ImmA (M78 family) [Nitrospirillum amazonense]
MNEDLLMDLADCGSPEKIIAAILKHHPNLPKPVPIEVLARAVGIIDFKDLEAEGFEGALTTDAEKRKGIILTKKGAREERRRFTVAHELGHFLIPTHKGNRQCTAADLRESRSNNDQRRQEAEANRFAAGILMPRPWFVRDMNSLGDADVIHAQKLASDYRTSLEATVNRYIELTDDVCAFVFSKDNNIRYVRRTNTFPRLAIKQGDPLPTLCTSRVAPAMPLRVATDWAEVDGSVWLETEWGKRPSPILEQSMRQAGGFQVTLLFLAADEEEEEDGDLSEKWDARFRGR